MVSSPGCKAIEGKLIMLNSPEISRATSHGDDDPANAASKHNVASAAAYLDMLMDNASKVTSCFLRDADRLASTWAIPQLPISQSRHRPLPVVLKELLISLRGKSGDSSDLDFDVPDLGESSSTSAAEQSSIMEESIIDSENSRVHDKLPSRQPGADPLWAIADVMLSKLENLLSRAPREHTSESVTNSVHGADTGGMLHATRVTENKVTQPYSCMGVVSALLMISCSSHTKRFISRAVRKVTLDYKPWMFID